MTPKISFAKLVGLHAIDLHKRVFSSEVKLLIPIQRPKGPVGYTF